MSGAREQHLVELVDESGRPVGASTVTNAHTAPGQLHRAFSVLLFDADGRMLLQRRAAVKTRFPQRWANACCGHPAPGEAVTVAAARRLDEELGVSGVSLAEVGVYSYAARDPDTGLIEKEYDHVVVGHVPGDLTLRTNPFEVDDTRWTHPAALAPAGEEYAPWLHGVLSIALSVITLPELP